METREKIKRKPKLRFGFFENMIKIDKSLPRVTKIEDNSNK